MLRKQVLQIVYVVSIFLGWGLSTFIMGFTGKYMDFKTALFCNMLGMILMNLFFLNDISWTITPYHLTGVLAGVLITVADLAYYKLSESGMDVSVIGPISSLYTLVPAILGVLVLKEQMSTRKLIGILLAVFAMYLLSTSDSSHKEIPPVRKTEDV